MKRSLTVLAGMILILGAAGCSKDSAPSPAPSTTATTTSAAPTTSARPDQPTTTVPQPAPTTTIQRGADGSTGNNLSAEYCAKNQDPGCPLGSYVGPNAIPNPNGDGTWVPCESSICTNPNHGAGPETTAPPVEPTTTTPPADNARVEGAPCEGDGTWVHLEGGNAGHYGTEWLCRH